MQLASATSTRASADSTWNCTNYLDELAEASAYNVGTSLTAETVTIARRVSTATWTNQSTIAKPANVSIHILCSTDSMHGAR